jgi:hypothetical protein
LSQSLPWKPSSTLKKYPTLRISVNIQIWWLLILDSQAELSLEDAAFWASDVEPCFELGPPAAAEFEGVSVGDEVSGAEGEVSELQRWTS